MAYADYKFYTESFGNVVPEADFPRLAERASDFVDTMTFDRLVDGLPTNERSQKRIKKAVCSLAELMYQIELAEKNAINQASTNLTDTNVGNICKRSSGRFFFTLKGGTNGNKPEQRKV